MIRSILFHIAFSLNMALFFILFLPLYPFPRKINFFAAKLWAKSVAFLLRVIVGTRLTVKGLENLKEGGQLIAAKHQSMLETILLLDIIPNPVFVLKEELTRIPLYGAWIKKFEMIAIDRQGQGKALKQSLDKVGEALKKGYNVILFPEGTRKAPSAPPAYKGGIAMLAHGLNIPIVPLALNTGYFWPRTWQRHGGEMVISILPPLPLAQSPKETLKHLETTLEEEQKRLPAR